MGGPSFNHSAFGLGENCSKFNYVRFVVINCKHKGQAYNVVGLSRVARRRLDSWSLYLEIDCIEFALWLSIETSEARRLDGFVLLVCGLANTAQLKIQARRASEWF